MSVIRVYAAVVIGSLVAIGVVSCSRSSTTEPLPDPSGVVEVTLTGAAGDDWGLILEMSSGATDVEGLGTDVDTRIAGGGYRVLVIGPLSSGALMRVTVADTTVVPTFTLQEVAARDGTLRTELSGYGLSVTRP